ncbi:unnamed protein product (macronuclear) [Paramecium tetraurelia]|uniref:Uncharacterized protein n=1 Tax=Paramecium tetraurelia TaxID=5888 RepID=A0C311_PARTE|nr:uncharacterized protein GSPATT00034656001 [Paramecium tetraurelia]CAK65178.1 unnamed protein product [Paramecium tetraurelia]|eukprot:XP_001432575.1 hypothetical protein (macronuclear) [Paramecium tetraurelia strain d4-2]
MKMQGTQVLGIDFLLDRCLTEGKIKLYHIYKAEILVTLSSTNKPFKICQIKLFKTTKSLLLLAHVGDLKPLNNSKSINLQELQTRLIEQYQQQQQPIEEVQILLNSYR